ncbi:MAG: virulence factor BrkB family protein, partial [Gammaproteobacteria bacterium]|nr:virulence factor BrkB family protein [Gammaproteobacteria bacterium]
MKKKTNLTIETALQHSLDFLKLLLSRFMSNNSLQNAAAMTYTTLLSLVPLIAVSIAVFSVFPIADQVSLAVQDFVFENFVPASSDVLQSYLDEFSGKAAKMTGTSFVFLVIVAVMLMASIDQAFNRIWRVKRKRGFMKQFMVYWSVLSLGPILIALSIAVTSYIISLPLLSDSGVLKPAGKLLVFAPVAVSAIAFMLMYSVIPNRPVPLKHALMGGFVAAILFELSKRGFGFYVTHFPTYEAIYGALATIPIFLVWLYLCWLVTLLGAEFTYCLSVYR